MALDAGTKLGRYEVLSQIGAGGMGEVYRARDPKINREVAIKVLPPDFSLDAERLRRFEQEAQAAGALNHPNVLAIYDVETSDGHPYVVSELLNGETLREQMGGTPMPVRRAVDYALQIANGLAAAHERGIVHRDLKPENIFVTTDERVKILDFGLAKLCEPAGAGTFTDVPTRKINTNPGTVMGTVGYMSPEQVRGLAVDQRTDIFSYGCVLYEMLAGRRAFRGDTPADTISSILREDPPELAETNKLVAPGLQRIVRHCLEKAPANRFQTARDLAFALESLSTASGITTTTVEQPSGTVEIPRSSNQRTRRRELLPWAIAALLLVAAGAFAFLYFRQTEPRPEAVRFNISAPDKQTYGAGFAISPDGRRMVFVVRENGPTQLWVRAVDSFNGQLLSGTQGATFPFWSPDSRFIGFFADGKLKKIEATGGPTQSLADVSTEVRGGSWSSDGVILFTPSTTDGLFKISSAGGTATPVTVPDSARGELSNRWPWFLPDGRHFLYTARFANPDNDGFYISALDSNEKKFLAASKSRGAFVPTGKNGEGYLLSVRDGVLVAQTFNSNSLQLSGELFNIAEGVLAFPGESGPTAYAAFTVSNTGHISFLAGRPFGTKLTMMDRSGKAVADIGAAASYSEPWLSPDEKRIIASSGNAGGRDLWIIDVARGTATRFTFDPASDASPLWSPDGSRIFFASARDGKHQLFQKVSTGAGSEEMLLSMEGEVYPDDISHDGRFLLFESDQNKRGKWDIWVFPLFGDRKPYAYLQSEFDESHSQFSPDGKFVAYTSNESGRAEVYVQGFPESGGKWQISTNGGDQPQWRRDGKEIFYLAPDKSLIAVPVTTSSSIEVGSPVTLFKSAAPNTSISGDRNYYFPTRDGQRFLFCNELESASSEPVSVILNWAANVKH